MFFQRFFLEFIEDLVEDGAHQWNLRCNEFMSKYFRDHLSSMFPLISLNSYQTLFYKGKKYLGKILLFGEDHDLFRTHYFHQQFGIHDHDLGFGEDISDQQIHSMINMLVSVERIFILFFRFKNLVVEWCSKGSIGKLNNVVTMTSE